jgi:hypothetical protein
VYRSYVSLCLLRAPALPWLVHYWRGLGLAAGCWLLAAGCVRTVPSRRCLSVLRQQGTAPAGGSHSSRKIPYVDLEAITTLHYILLYCHTTVIHTR